MAWLNSMAALMSSDELSKDVASAEALLEAQQVHQWHVISLYVRVYVPYMCEYVDIMTL